MPDPARRYSHITKAIYERPWAIQPSMLAVIDEVMRHRALGSPLTDEEIEARLSAERNGPRAGAARAQGVAVIPIYGVLAPRMDLMTAMSGGSSVQGIRQAFREAQADPDIGAIVFDVDSPGGAVDGIFELADEIRAARGGKPMVAVANAMMASAAYAIGSAADELVVTPSGQVGSVGVVAMRPDQTGADEQDGVTWNVITAGGHKDTWNPHVALSDDGRDEIQAAVNDYYALFVSGVTAGRGVTAERVTDEWQARMFTARKAVAAGLADRVETLDAATRRMILQANQTSAAAAQALAAAGFTAQEHIGVLLGTLPATDQRAVLDEHLARLQAEAAPASEPPAEPEPESLPDGPEEATATAKRLSAARARAAIATAHVRIPSQEVTHVEVH